MAQNQLLLQALTDNKSVWELAASGDKTNDKQNCIFKTLLLSSQDEITDFINTNQIANILIIDHPFEQDRLYKISKNIIDLTDTQVNYNITLRKPFLLLDLLKILKTYVQDDGIFCCINKHLIYNQKKSEILDLNTNLTIQLTAKENQIFGVLLTSQDFMLNKKILLSKIWPNSSTETSTLEFHLINLRQKLNNLFTEGPDQHLKLLINTVDQ